MACLFNITCVDRSSIQEIGYFYLNTSVFLNRVGLSGNQSIKQATMLTLRFLISRAGYPAMSMLNTWTSHSLLDN